LIVCTPATEDSIRTLPELLPSALICEQSVARLLAGLDVVGADEALAAGRHRGVDGDDLDATVAGALDRRVQRLGEVRREDDRVDAARDRVLEQLDLLVDVGLGRRPEEPDLQPEVRGGLARAREHRLPERRVGGLDDGVDLCAGRGSTGAARTTAAVRCARRGPATTTAISAITATNDNENLT
jgi:hypothetical protein